MIKKGSFVRYIGPDRKEAFHGKYLSVADRKGDDVELFRWEKNKWVTFTVKVTDLEEVC